MFDLKKNLGKLRISTCPKLHCTTTRRTKFRDELLNFSTELLHKEKRFLSQSMIMILTSLLTLSDNKPRLSFGLHSRISTFIPNAPLSTPPRCRIFCFDLRPFKRNNAKNRIVSQSSRVSVTKCSMCNNIGTVQ